MNNKELVQHSKYFHIFIENHLNVYPEERINTFGLTEEVDPIAGMQLMGFSNTIKEEVLKDNISSSSLSILKDLHATASKLNIEKQDKSFK